MAKYVPGLATLGIADLFLLHLGACLVVPWTARESTVAFAPLLIIWAVTFLVPQDTGLELLDRVVLVILSPMILVPGMMIASWWTKRRKEDAERLRLNRQVQSLGGELSRARIVHDAMFPQPCETGYLSFDYQYLPIAEIGGDYVHIYVCPRTDRLTMTLLDVAGHGLAAALTVNRLFGELERIRAENPTAQPAQVMVLLNRYINLTMAPVNLYATGTCMMLDPASGELVWVNAGHPPAFLRHEDGRVSELSGTAMLLGALDYDEFDANQQVMTIHPGDTIIAYTDGAFEARNADDKQFGLKRLRETARFSPPPRNWTKFIATAVAQHHQGRADDDVLIASLTLKNRRFTLDGPPHPVQT